MEGFFYEHQEKKYEDEAFSLACLLQKKVYNDSVGLQLYRSLDYLCEKFLQNFDAIIIQIFHGCRVASKFKVGDIVHEEDLYRTISLNSIFLSLEPLKPQPRKEK
jgi:hypothetical protein